MSDAPGSLREEQVQVTRERLMEAMLAILAEGIGTHVAVADVAARAGVSARTAYRHYPSSEALLDAFNEWARKRYVPVTPPRDADGYPEFIERLARSYGESASLFKAMRTSATGNALQGRRRKGQAKQVESLLGPRVAHLDEQQRKRALAVLHLMCSSDAFLFLADNWDLEEPGEAMRWAAETLLGALAAPEKRGKR